MSTKKIILNKEENSSGNDKESNALNCISDNPFYPSEKQLIVDLSQISSASIQKEDNLNNIFKEKDEQSNSNFMYFPENDGREDSDFKTPPMSFKSNREQNQNFSDNKNADKNIKKEKQPNSSSKETKETSEIKKVEIEKVEINNHIKSEPRITNITCNANLNCIVNLKTISLMEKNVKYNPKNNNFLVKKLEKSNITANIFSSGKITCSGAKSKEELYKALKKFKKIITRCGFDASIKKKEIIIRNISSTCSVDFRISLLRLYAHLKNISKSGETVKKPEKFPGLIYKKKIGESNISYTIFDSGNINITGAKKEEHIQEAFRTIYPELLKAKIP